jgi:NADH dehydrogenase/NADH:ubiquinone oxidoreductase subunit G
MPKVTIDGQSIEVPEGTTILNAARMIGGDIVPPAMCYYSSLKTSGGYCRTCIVEVSKGSDKDPRPMPKPVASCRTTVMDGMEVKGITSPSLLEARAGVVEFLLIKNPLRISTPHFRKNRYRPLYQTAHDPLHSLLPLCESSRPAHQWTCTRCC